MTESLQALHALILDGNLNEAARMCDQLTAQQCKGCDVPQDGVYTIGEPKSTVVQQGDDYKAWYEEAMIASNEAGFVGMDAASTIRALAATHPTQHGRGLEAVIKSAADKLDAAKRCHPNAVETLIDEALEILDEAQAKQ